MIAAEAVADPTTGIDWPTLGVAGGAIAAFVLTLAWLVRWTTRARDAEVARIEAAAQRQVDAAEAEKLRAIAAAEGERDRTVAAAVKERDAWKAAHDALATTHTETVRTLAESINANRWLDMLIKGRANAPQQGDNTPEGVTA